MNRPLISMVERFILFWELLVIAMLYVVTGVAKYSGFSPFLGMQTYVFPGIVQDTVQFNRTRVNHTTFPSVTVRPSSVTASTATMYMPSSQLLPVHASPLFVLNTSWSFFME